MDIQLKECLMEIKGKVHCMFEQSGTFKNEFKKLGYEAYDYDIQNNFGETDYVMDLFHEIEQAYDNKPSIFDNITPDDLIMAFFPCIYFTGSSNPLFFCGTTGNYKSFNNYEKVDKILQRARDREYFYELLLKFVGICYKRKIRMIFENPYDDTMHFLKNNFIEKPKVWDKNRMLRGDYFVKPTAYWFINCDPTQGFSYQFDKEQKIIRKIQGSKGDGLCSEERSMISPDYARNWICDFVLGKKQDIGQLQLF
jgi:hypothetical protein